MTKLEENKLKLIELTKLINSYEEDISQNLNAGESAKASNIFSRLDRAVKAKIKMEEKINKMEEK